MKDFIIKELIGNKVCEVEEACKKVGVNIRDDDGNYKTTEQVLYELSKVLNDN